MIAITKKIFLLCFSSLFLFSSEVTLYSACDKKPYSYCENGEVKGINVEIYKAIFHKIQDYSVKIKGIKWEEGLKKMENKEIKILGSISYNPQDYPFIHEDTSSKDFKNLIKKHLDCSISDEIKIENKIAEQIKIHQENNQSIQKLKKIKEILTLNAVGQQIAFSNSSFIFKEDLMRKINIAIKIMPDSKKIDNIIKNTLESHLNPNKNKTIRIPVYNWGQYLSDRIPSHGVLAEVVEKAFENQNIKIIYEFVHSNYAYLLTKWGKSCVTLPWAKTEEKHNYMYFSDPIKSSKTYLFYSKKNFKNGINYNTLDDLKPYRIGGVNKHLYNEVLEKYNIEYTSFTNLKDAIKALLSNKIDIIPATKEIFISDSKRFFFNDIENLSFHKKSFIDSNIHILFSKRCENATVLRDKFNKGFKNIQQNGILKEILKKYDMPIEDFIKDEINVGNKNIPLNKNAKICQDSCNTFLQTEKITFNSGTSIIQPENETLFKKLYQILLSCPETQTNIIGHTDNTGSNKSNQKLSLQRAEAVVNRLVNLGIDKTKIHATGQGESSPITSNTTKEGQERNRRIECKTLQY